MFQSLSEVRQANRNIGHHFFDRGFESAGCAVRTTSIEDGICDFCEEIFESPLDETGHLCDECGQGHCYPIDAPEDREDSEIEQI